MDKKIIGTLVIVTLAIVFIVGYSYSIFGQSNQNSNIPSPTPIPTPTPTLSPSEEPTEPASITKPSVPEFTVDFFDSSYDVPTTYSIDPYTGETMAHEGYHVENKTTQIRIKNQPFTPYQIQEDGKNWTINLFYNIRIKGHFAPDWGYYRLHNGSSDGNLVQDYGSEYTVVPIDSYLPSEGQVDFQIEALIGYERGIVTVPGAPGTQRIITGETSGWSETITITFP